MEFCKVSQSGRILYIVSINIAIFVVMLITANFLAGLVIDLRLDRLLEKDDRASLPNYSDKAYANTIFDEFNSLFSEYRAYVGWSKREFHGITTNINNAGDRIHKPTTQNPVGVVRFFGGSTMWGTGADDNGTIPALFNQLFPSYRVFNHGESGYLSRQSLARLVNLAVLNEPMDLVVFYDGVNDVQYHCGSDNVAMNEHGRAERIANLVEMTRTERILYGNLKELTTEIGSRLKDAMFDQNLDMNSKCEIDSAYAQRVASILIESWKVAHSVVTGKGGRFVAILQPVIYIGNPKHDYLDLSVTDRRARSYRAVYPFIQKFIAETNVDWIYDFSNSFDRDEFIYVDFAHVSQNGNRIVAERLANLLGDDPIRLKH